MFDVFAEKIAGLTASRVKSLTEEAYAAGYEAGYTAHAFKDREDQNRRLKDMYDMGKQRGREEAQAEAGEIDEGLFKTLTDMAEKEAAARQAAAQLSMEGGTA